MYLEKDIDELSELFVDNILETNRSFDVYVNWNNATKDNFSQFDIELNAMNCLIKNASREQFEKLFIKLPTVACTFPLLIAIAKVDRTKLLNGKEPLIVVNKSDMKSDFSKYDLSYNHLSSSGVTKELELYYDFFVQSGLQNLFQNMLEKSVIDYVTGVLVGLDSNGRKNRSGSAFEITCESIVNEIAKKYDLTVITQKPFKVLRNYNFNISKDIENRKADFILFKDDKVLNIEVDYFFSGGSKPEEIIDSYINRQKDLSNLGFGFALITDGNCWDNKNKSQLQKGFRHLDYLLNFHLAKQGMLEEALVEYFEVDKNE